ncbi:helix-turn-helix domain-containing protein [Effusibacillus consociatus]|uniref:Helix-turn-helix domain-containing protein n=1 Tax=Effusibacillus consociatus TaxID=1117041 RepID=A0ABV9PYL7_9BACL
MARPKFYIHQEAFVEARIDSGLSQRELAEAIDYSFSHVSQVERGERHPSPRFVEKVCKLLNKSRHELFYTEKQKDFAS